MEPQMRSVENGISAHSFVPIPLSFPQDEQRNSNAETYLCLSYVAIFVVAPLLRLTFEHRRQSADPLTHYLARLELNGGSGWDYERAIGAIRIPADPRFGEADFQDS